MSHTPTVLRRSCLALLVSVLVVACGGSDDSKPEQASAASELGRRQTQSVATSDSQVASLRSAFAQVTGITDPGMQECLESTLGKAMPDITDADLAGVTQLDCTDLGIATLDGLSALPNLEVLSLPRNAVSSIDPAVPLARLRLLNVADNSITAIQALVDQRQEPLRLLLNLNCVPDLAAIVAALPPERGLMIDGASQQFSSCDKRGAVLVSFEPYVTKLTGQYAVTFRTSFNPRAACAVDWGDGTVETVSCNGQVHYLTHAYADKAARKIGFIVDGVQVAQKAFNAAPVVKDLTVSKATIGSALNGSLLVSDADGDSITNLRVHVARTEGGSECQIDVGGSYFSQQAAGAKAFFGCTSMTATAGTLYLKVEARDSKGAQAAVVSTTTTVGGNNAPPVVSNLSVPGPVALGAPIAGGFDIADAEKHQVKNLRVHLSRVLGGSDCYVDIGDYASLQPLGHKDFSGCPTMAATAGTVYLKVEARDEKGAQAAVVSESVQVGGANTPPKVNALVATSPLSIGQPVAGSFAISDAEGDMVRGLRVHISRTLGGSDCFVDVGAYDVKQLTGNKVFSGCPAMTSSAGTLYLKVEAYDDKGAQAKVVSAQVEVRGNSAPVVTDFLVTSPLWTTKSYLDGSFTISDPDGDLVKNLRVHLARTYDGSECRLDVGTGYDKLQAGGTFYFAGCGGLLTSAGTVYLKVEARDANGNQAVVQRQTVAVNYNERPVVQSFLVAPSTALGAPVTGSITVRDTDDQNGMTARIWVGRSLDAKQCQISLAGNIAMFQNASFSGCSNLTTTAGTLYLMTEIMDAKSAFAEVVRTTTNVVQGSAPYVSNLTGVLGPTALAIDFDVNDADAENLAVLRLHLSTDGATFPCWQDLPLTLGRKSFQFTRTSHPTCASLFLGSGSRLATFKIEAIDPKGLKAPVSQKLAVYDRLPPRVDALGGAQAGTDLRTTFTVVDDDQEPYSLVRVHVTSPLSTDDCFVDSTASAGAKVVLINPTSSLACSHVFPTSGSATLGFKVEALDTSGNKAAVVSSSATYTATTNAKPVITGLTATTPIAVGGALAGGFTITDPNGDQITKLRVHASYTYDGSSCQIDVGTAYTGTQPGGAKTFSGCSSLTSTAGTVYLKVEGWDVNGLQADVVRTSVQVNSANAKPVITGLTATTPITVGAALSGGFTITDPNGDQITKLRVHASYTYDGSSCQIDVGTAYTGTQPGGAKTFSGCSSLTTTAGTVYLKVEGWDVNGLQADVVRTSVQVNSANAKPVITGLTATTPITVGAALSGGFAITDPNGDQITKLRVHASYTYDGSSCQIDVGTAYTGTQPGGAKTFSGCSSLTTTAGTVYLKVEGWDVNGLQADVVRTTVQVNAANAKPVITGLSATTPITVGGALAGGFTITDPNGDQITKLRVHASYTYDGSSCQIDVGTAYTGTQPGGAKTFSDCAWLTTTAGTVYLKVEGWDVNGLQADVVRTTVQVNAANAKPVITGLSATTPITAGAALSGGFTITDPNGDQITKLRVHASYTYDGSSCQIDVGTAYTGTQPGGAKTFSDCAWLTTTAGTVYLKVEGWDVNGLQADVVRTTVQVNSANAKPVITGLTATTPITAGAALSGGFTITDPNGDQITKLRVHASYTYDGSSCQIDVGTAYTGTQPGGAKTFSGCSSLTTTAGTVYLKVEGWDVNGLQADVVRTSVQVNAATPNVTGRSPATLTRNVATTVTVTGQNLPATTAFAIDNVVCNGNYSRVGSTSVSQTCTAQTSTPNPTYLLVKDAPGGNILNGGNRNFSFTVQ